MIIARDMYITEENELTEDEILQQDYKALMLEWIAIVSQLNGKVEWVTDTIRSLMEKAEPDLPPVYTRSKKKE